MAMKTLLIIEDNIERLESLIDTCRLSQEEYTIISAQDEESAHSTLEKGTVDLIICNTTLNDAEDCAFIKELSTTLPYIPLLAISTSGGKSCDRAREIGAVGCFTYPVTSKQFNEQVSTYAAQASTGTVKDIPIHSFLQMLENEEKSCTLQIFSGLNIGFIYIHDGVLVDAKTEQLDGEQAIYEIISWPEVIIEIKFYNNQREKSITKPLISLIMEGFRLKDEREERRKQEQTIVKPQHSLKKVSITGQRLALDIGLKIKIEFNTIEAPLESYLIGLIPENSIIVSTPSHFIVTHTTLPADTIALIKFIYRGRLCLFKSKLIRSLEQPYHMLFFEYPSVIHYHEMRKAKRTSIHIPCTLNLNDDERYFATFTDLSSSGGLCLVRTKGNDTLPQAVINQEIDIHCILPGLEEEQHISAIVRNLRTSSQEVLIGVEFSAVSTYLKETIRQYLYTVENKSIFQKN
ncbi:MAG: DUF4388 domain-containing protein [Desulfobulbaceae bacterium]|nr:MAG: DUF4388 domain-containing protein [Desulfobulbaceae bacterium]